MKKYFLAIYFSICLEFLFMKIVKERKKFFLSIWPEEFKRTEKSFQDFIFNRTGNFFKLVYQQV